MDQDTQAMIEIARAAGLTTIDATVMVPNEGGAAIIRCEIAGEAIQVIRPRTGADWAVCFASDDGDRVTAGRVDAASATAQQDLSDLVQECLRILREDDVFAVVRLAVAEANRLIKPYQAAVKAGDWVIVQGPDLLIYGQIKPEDRTPKGFVYGQWFSKGATCGEWGDNHRSTIRAVITAQLFAAADQAGWPETWPEVLGLLGMPRTV